MQLDVNRGYDIIGDVHGCADALVQLLSLLGYKKQHGVWWHPSRKAVFLGNIVDRGTHIREALHLIRDMVDNDQAICLMGNYEFNILGWFTALDTDPDTTVIPHTERYVRNLRDFLAQFSLYPDDLKDFVQWFGQLPLLVDAGRFRAVHACWDNHVVDTFTSLSESHTLTADLIQDYIDPDTFGHKLIERLLKGVRLPLLDGYYYMCEDGYIRRNFRAKFWAQTPVVYDDIVFQANGLPDEMKQMPITPRQKGVCTMYRPDDPLLFVGHYWCRGTPVPVQANLACLDYSAVRNGKLAAYRMDNESQLLTDKFIWVDVKANKI